VDVNRVLEIYRGNAALNFLLVGYYTSDAVFFTNGILKSPPDWGWADVSIAANTGADTAIAAIFETVSGAYNDYGYRKNGSTDSYAGVTYQHYTIGAVIGVDANEICEIYSQYGYGGWLSYLVGYIKSDHVFYTNATVISGGTINTWTDCIVPVPAGGIGAYVAVWVSFSSLNGLRKRGTTENIFRMTDKRGWFCVECDLAGGLQYYKAHAETIFAMQGYATGVAVAYTWCDVSSLDDGTTWVERVCDTDRMSFPWFLVTSDNRYDDYLVCYVGTGRLVINSFNGSIEKTVLENSWVPQAQGYEIDVSGDISGNDATVLILINDNISGLYSFIGNGRNFESMSPSFIRAKSKIMGCGVSRIDANKMWIIAQDSDDSMSTYLGTSTNKGVSWSWQQIEDTHWSSRMKVVGDDFYIFLDVITPEQRTPGLYSSKFGFKAIPMLEGEENILYHDSIAVKE
jgi:hypothetical protein